MWEFLRRLFDTEDFPPRWSCGEWSEALGWLHIGSDLTTAAAYIAIPCVLGWFVSRRPDLPFPRVFWLFVGFIFACGSVHLVEAVIFWQPVYRLSGLLKASTAVLSVATAVALFPTMRRALALPGFHRATSRLASIVSASSDAIISKALDGTIESWNLAAERMYGYTAEEIVGRPITTIVPPERSDEIDRIMARVAQGETVGPLVTERVAKSGQRIPISLGVSPVFDASGRIVGASAISRDITLQRQSELNLERTAWRLERANEKLREIANHDPLTGLLNRRGLKSEFDVELRRMRRSGNRAAFVFVDCDDFKTINDRYGHDRGDEALREIAVRIESASRESDRVARIGGDEFVVLAPDTRIAEGMRLAERIRRSVADVPVELVPESLRIHVSCGVEDVESDASFEELIARASASLKRSKTAGKNMIATSDPMQAKAAEAALEGLRSFGHPIVEVATGATVGYEFLIRGPAGPFEEPARLFRACRASASLTETDLACLARCVDAARGLAPGLRVHVNLFPSTLLEVDSGLLEERLRQEAGTRQLCVELDESLLVGDLAALVACAAAIRDATGCRFAVDDVGFGRSSLEALVLLEPEVVKIDPRHVRGVSRDAGARRRLARLVQIGRAIDSEIIAEGVEEECDRQAISDLGIELAQGYLWGRPAPLN